MAYVLGITGGIASGKSTVLKLFEALGAETLSADDLAREVLTKGGRGYDEVVACFGSGILDKGGEIDRRRLGEMVFADPKAREKLNSITHPLIIERLRQAVDEFRRRYPGRGSVLAVEIPLLFECGLEGLVDEVVVVAAEQATQLNRLTSVGGLSREQAEARIRSQMPIAEKIRRAGRVVYNDGEIQSLEEAVRRIWGEICLP